jgi:hypothetical protein
MTVIAEQAPERPFWVLLVAKLPAAAFLGVPVPNSRGRRLEMSNEAASSIGAGAAAERVQSEWRRKSLVSMMTIESGLTW